MTSMPNSINAPSSTPISVSPTEDGGIEVVLAPETPYEPGKFMNIISRVSERRLTELASIVAEGFDIDHTSMEDWLAKYAKWSRMWYVRPEVEKKNDPFQDASNVIVPLTNVACTQFYARSSDALLSQKDIVKAVAENAQIQASADRVSKHMNWQLGYKIPNYYQGFQKSLMLLALAGTVVRKVYYNRLKRTAACDFIAPQNFIINFNTRYLDDCPRKTHVRYETINDMRLKQQAGEYSSVEKILAPTTTLDLGNVEVVIEENTGTNQTDDNRFGYRKVLEQHVLLPILDENGKEYADPDNNIARHYIITMDYETKTILSIVDNEDQNGQAVEYFVKYEFLPSPDDTFFGVGFGMLLERINDTSNTVINQLIDAGTLANTQSGFVMKGTGTRRGQIQLDRGRFIEIDLPRNVDDIRKAVSPMSFNQPSNVLYQLLGTMEQFANRITTVSEMFTGEMPRSDTSATAVTSLIEQGLKVFASIYKSLHQSFSKELGLLYNMNGMFLDEREYFTIVSDIYTAMDEGMSPQDLRRSISKADYQHKLMVLPVSDPGVISKSEKVQKAQLEYEVAMKNPLVANNPIAMYGFFERYMRLLDDNPNSVGRLLAPVKQQIDMQRQQQEMQQAQMQQQQQVMQLFQQELAAGRVPPQLMQQAALQFTQMQVRAQGGQQGPQAQQQNPPV